MHRHAQLPLCWKQKMMDLKIQLLATMKIALISLLSMTWHQVTKRPKRPAMNGTKLKVGTKTKNKSQLAAGSEQMFICFERQIWRSKRPSVTCLMCASHEELIRIFSSHGQVPLARGIRADGKDRLIIIIDHLESAMHQEAERLEEHAKTWAQMSDSHPWARILNKTNTETRIFLVRLAIDVYNDSLVETLSAKSWPSRSMSCEYVNNVLD